jgi:hypothetical protein
MMLVMTKKMKLTGGLFILCGMQELVLDVFKFADEATMDICDFVE